MRGERHRALAHRLSSVAEAVRSTINKRDAHGVVRHGAEWLTLWADPLSVLSPEERLAQRQAARAQERRSRAIAATMRAIAHEQAIGQTAPAVPASPTEDDWILARGRADDAGLRLRHHDPALHARIAPPDAQARGLFDRLERARWQALGVRRMPGTLPNLAATLGARLDLLGLRHAHLAAQVPLAEALPALALATLLGHDAPLFESGAMATWHSFAHRGFGGELAALRPLLADQAAFAEAARLAIAAMFAAMEWDDAPRLRPTDAAAQAAERRARHGVATAAEEPDTAAMEEAGRGEAAAYQDGRGPEAVYRVYTTAFDRVAHAADLAEADDLVSLRQVLDRSLGEVHTPLSRLANRLQRQLLAEQLTAWDFDREEGLLDAARLDRVVVNPGTARSFKQEREAAGRDTVVTILLDNSGSMRGRPGPLAATAADMAARVLDRCGIACEVLGFTTGGWKGGESARSWIAAGRPAEPGRLADLLHIVYKSADAPYRQAQLGFGLMLRDDLLRENIDGEALLWAAGRLRARAERRKLLLVISDGAPSDRATQDANADRALLQRHLLQVVDSIERQGRIELSAIGIAHPVDQVYRNAVTIARPDQLSPALLAQLGRSLRQRRTVQPAR